MATGPSLLWVLFGVAALLPSPCHARSLKLRCGSGPRCGNRSVVMHSGTAGTNTCREVCVMYPLFRSGLTCGRCGIPPSAPTMTSPQPTPPPLPTKVPLPPPTKVPVSSPVKSPGPVAAPTKAPVGSPTKAPASPTKAPIVALTKAPVPTLPSPSNVSPPSPTKAPVSSPTKAPGPVAAPTKAPVGNPTKALVPSPTKAPIVALTKAPVPTPPSPTKAPVHPPTSAPVKPPTKAPVRPPTSAPVKPPTKAPVRPPTSAPVKPPTKAPVRPPTSAPVKPPTKSPVRPPTSAPVKPPTKAPAHPPTSAPVKPPTKAPVRPPTKAPVPVSPSPTKAPVRAYNIELGLSGIPTADQSFYTGAATRWSTVITNDLPDISTNGLANNSPCTYPGVVDDLFICASYAVRDGPLGVLGSGGPTYVRTDSGLPITGFTECDVDDISILKADGRYHDHIMHEIGHVIGLGTLWYTQGAGNASIVGCPYQGRNANREYQAITGCSAVPIEQGGGPGTACGHWDEACLVNELMTGYSSANTTALLSRITVGSVQDLGYVVDYSQADNYTSANLGPNCLCGRRRNMMEMLHGETVQLGLRSPGSKKQRDRRRMSDKAHKMALDTGHSILQERSAAKWQQNSQVGGAKRGKLFDNALGVTYVGDQVVSVFVFDDGEVFGVVVRKDNE